MSPEGFLAILSRIYTSVEQLRGVTLAFNIDRPRRSIDRCHDFTILWVFRVTKAFNINRLRRSIDINIDRLRRSIDRSQIYLFIYFTV